MQQPEAEGRKATWLRRGDERAACTCQSEPARGCCVSLRSACQSNFTAAFAGDPLWTPEKKRKRKSLKFVT